MKSNSKLTYCFFITFFAIIFAAGILETKHAVFSYHGQEVTIKLKNAHFLFLKEKGIHQIKVLTEYNVTDSSILGNKINAVMKIYSNNGSLIKTSSFPDGFVVNMTGIQQLATNVLNSTLQNITAVTTFTNEDKVIPLSNSLKININLGQIIKND